MIAIICDVCEKEDGRTNATFHHAHSVKIIDVSSGTDFEQAIYICDNCRQLANVHDVPTINIREALVEVLKARVLNSVRADKTECHDRYLNHISDMQLRERLAGAADMECVAVTDSEMAQIHAAQEKQRAIDNTEALKGYS